MKRFVIFYGNGVLEQVSEMNSTLERQVNRGIINFIIDTKAGTVLGKNGNGPEPAQWFDIQDGEPDAVKETPEKK
jgi:hypothetical protein